MLPIYLEEFPEVIVQNLLIRKATSIQPETLFKKMFRHRRFPVNLVRFFKAASLHKIPKFNLVSWRGNFVERHGFRRVSGDSQKLLFQPKISSEGN